MSSEGNSGILPPEQEATFENASNEAQTPPVEEEAVAENNSPLGNASNVVEVPSTALNSLSPAAEALPSLNSAVSQTGKTKKAQTPAQRKVMNNQGIERQALKNAGVEKPSVAMVATLASMKAKGDQRYNSAFANAVSGKGLGIYRSEKTARSRAKKGNTVVNSTPKNNSAATSFMTPSPAANARANNGAAKNTIQGIEDMGNSAIQMIRNMMTASKTLTRELAKTNNGTGLTSALNTLGLAATQKKRPRAPRSRKAKPLPVIPEESEQNAFSAPPGGVNVESLSL